MISETLPLGFPSARTALNVLPFTIVGCSSSAPSFPPHGILYDLPEDQSSRWSSAVDDQHQFLMLRLAKPALLRTITLGKFHKMHVCNLREFIVEAGPCEEQLEPVLHEGLRNDSESETFPVRAFSSISNATLIPLPVRYVKIRPLATWGSNFNFSIWFLELRGIDSAPLVAVTMELYQQATIRNETKLVLQYLDKLQMADLANELMQRTGIALEHPRIKALREAISAGAFELVEKLLIEAESIGDFEEYLSEIPPLPKWTRLSCRQSIDLDEPVYNTNSSHHAEAASSHPRPRGGHQMVWDSTTRSIYLHGGWDGNQDLADFWRFAVDDCQWTLLSEDTRIEGGPSPRSCHKMVIFEDRRRIYLFGKYIDPETRANASLINELFVYEIDKGKWAVVDEDARKSNGPPLLYDHQMAIDEERGVIWVFGGRTISEENSNEPVYAGLYAYDLHDHSWRLVRSDDGDAGHPPASPYFKSRIGHAMVFNKATRQLLIYAGQRGKDYLCDMYAYDVDTDTVTQLAKDSARIGGPDAGFTQRGTIDVQKQKVYMFSGLVRERPTLAIAASAESQYASDSAKNSFWEYDLQKAATGAPKVWHRLYSNENSSEKYWRTMSTIEPPPRFAHQLVYDAKGQRHFLFGGNPGNISEPRKRLGDLWMLELEPAATRQTVLRKARLLVRREVYRQLCATVVESESLTGKSNLESNVRRKKAMGFLQNDLSQMVDHDILEESKSFRKLAAWLFPYAFAAPSSNVSSSIASPDSSQYPPMTSQQLLQNQQDMDGRTMEMDDPRRVLVSTALSRKLLFEQLLEWFPHQMIPPGLPKMKHGVARRGTVVGR